MSYPKHITTTFCLITMVLLASSCRKDKTIPTPVSGNCYCCEQVDAPGEIAIGNLTNMNILYPDSTLSALENFGDSAVYFMDVDMDGLNDLKIRGIMWDGGGIPGSFASETTIEPLHNQIWLAESEFPDTLYAYTSVEYTGSNPVIHRIDYHQNCVANSPGDSVISFSTYLNHYQTGNYLSDDQHWTNEKKHLYHHSLNNYISDDTSNPDTTIWYKFIYENSCHDIETGESTYIGVKKYYCGEEKLGWIKLSRLSGNAIQIQEVAIQK